MSFDYNTLIIDRTQADVETLRALVKKPTSQWTAAEAEAFAAGTLKGSYDYTDLNRVSACMEDLVSRLNGIGYEVPGYARGIMWHADDSLTDSDVEKYRLSAEAIRRALSLPDTVPKIPETLRKPTTDEVNAIESVLVAVDLILTHIPAARRHCGVTVCGLKGVIA